MTSVGKVGQDSAEAHGHDAGQSVLAEGECSLPEHNDRPSYATGTWLVRVHARASGHTVGLLPGEAVVTYR